MSKDIGAFPSFDSHSKEQFVRVVGIGASAGDLEALEQFFAAMGPQSGFAFLVVQHLSPDFKSMMGDISSRHTMLKVRVRPLVNEDYDESVFLISFEDEVVQVDIAVEPIEQYQVHEHMQRRITDLEKELLQVKQDLQMTIEELETSNQELQVTNEEMESANEELQSTNEELQSVNQELYTVNSEYQRKIAELTELNGDMNNLLWSTDVGTLFLDRDLRIRKFTPAIQRTFNILPQDIGRPIEHIAALLLYEDLLETVRCVLQTQESFQVEVQNRAGRWFLLRILPYRTDTEQQDGVLLTFVDISPVKVAATALQHQATLVRLLQTITASANEATDVQTTLYFALEQICYTFGWQAGHAYTVNQNRFSQILPSEIWYLSGEPFTDSVQSSVAACIPNVPDSLCHTVIEAGAPRWIKHLQQDSRFMERSTNAELRSWSALAVPVLIKREVVALLEFFAPHFEEPPADTMETLTNVGIQLGRVIERQQAAEALRHHERLVTLGTTAAKLVHEIGNPLNGMYTTVQLLQRHVSTDTPIDRTAVHSFVGDISKETQRLRSLLTSLRQLSRPSPKLQLQSESLSQIVNDLLATTEAEFGERRIQVENHLPPDGPLVLADADRLKQILLNLCKNAAEAMPQGGTMSLRLQPHTTYAILEVTDSGVGIPEGVDIFAPFYTTKNDGVGLGLAIVHQLVEAHHGSISFHSVPGQGTTFVLRLPLITQHETTLIRRDNSLTVP